MIQRYLLLDKIVDSTSCPTFPEMRARIPRLGVLRYRPLTSYVEACLLEILEEETDPIVKLAKTAALVHLHSVLAIGLFYPILWRWIAYVVRPTEEELFETCRALACLTSDRARRVQKAKSKLLKLGL